jgi:hypothetical protein
MLRCFAIIFVVFSIWGCIDKQKKIGLKDSLGKKINVAKTVITDTLDEEFIDSTKIGIKGLYKLELRKYRGADSVYVKIAFFEKGLNAWIEKQEFFFSVNPILSCDVELNDFNNDGLNDMTFQSEMAARGANEIRKLFIFDKTLGKLIFIKNSEIYPNMRYNKKLNCIDALLVSGSWVTVFLHLEKDTLREFASVAVRGDILNLTVTDRNGIEKSLIINKKVDFGMFPRFKNFSPLELADDSELKH